MLPLYREAGEKEGVFVDVLDILAEPHVIEASVIVLKPVDVVQSISILSTPLPSGYKHSLCFPPLLPSRPPPASALAAHGIKQTLSPQHLFDKRCNLQYLNSAPRSIILLPSTLLSILPRLRILLHHHPSSPNCSDSTTCDTPRSPTRFHEAPPDRPRRARGPRKSHSSR
jgi:hypothetical protein